MSLLPVAASNFRERLSSVARLIGLLLEPVYSRCEFFGLHHFAIALETAVASSARSSHSSLDEH